MKKRLFALLMALCFVASLIPAASAAEIASGTCGENLTWVLTEDGTLTISGTGEMEYYSSLGGPWQTYQEIINYVVIEDGVTSIAESAFQNCNKLTQIAIPRGITRIEEETFSGCTSLVSVSIPDSVTVIDRWAFANCESLTEIFLPSSVTDISVFAFNGCASMTDIQVDLANEYYCSVNGILLDKDMSTLYLHPAGRTNTQYTIPSTVYGIMPYAFYECKKLTNVVIPDSISFIGDYAFYGCTKLHSIFLPENCVDLGNIVFDKCDSMTAISVDPYNPCFSSIDGVLFSKDGTQLIRCPGGKSGTYSIPNSTITIENYAFDSCKKLTSVFIPASVALGEYRPFDCCMSLTNITVDNNSPIYRSIDGVLFSKDGTQLLRYPCGRNGMYIVPNGVTILGDSSFMECNNLSYVAIPNGVTALNDYTFYRCENLACVTIPVSVSSFGSFAFSECSNLKDIYYSGTEEQWLQINQNTFTRKDLENTTIHYNYVPSSFYDVPANVFYYEPVLWALENNITTGATETTFNPTGDCLRAQVVTFLWRAAGEPKPTSTYNPFVDVKPSDFYYDAVLWAVENGITNGADATHFNPMGVCNRAQVVTFLYRAFRSPDVENENNPFTDVPAGTWYTEPILWAVENGITNGLSATEFGPNRNCNRAQIVTFLYRAYN